MAIVNSSSVELAILNQASATADPAADAAFTLYKTIGHCTSLSLDINRENITITSKASNSYVERITGVRDWSGSGDGYTDFVQAVQNHNASDSAAGDVPADTVNVSELQVILDAGEDVFIRYGVGNSRFIGKALLTSVSLSGGTDEAPTYSFAFEGNGEITYDPNVLT